LVMNGEDFEAEDLSSGESESGSTDEVAFNDKRRFNEKGERVKVEVKDGSEANRPEAPEKSKSPEVIRLESQLIEMTVRCEAAELKLVEVQKRFELERARLESETAEMRERVKKTLEQRAEAARFEFLKALLPVLDNLNLAIEASEKDSSFEHLLEGVRGTARSFSQALLNVGVEVVPAIGEVFNPEIHEAVDIVHCEPEDDGRVLAAYSTGYTFKGRLLRPARVQVGTAAATGSAAE